VITLKKAISIILIGILFTTFLAALNPISATEGDKNWELNIGTVWSPAIGVDGTVYVASPSKLYAVNPDGTNKWEIALQPSLSTSAPAIAPDGTIYIGSTNGKLYAVNPDGTKKWEVNIANTESSPAIGSDGTIYIGGHGINIVLHAVTPDGAEKWRYIDDGVDGNNAWVSTSSPAIGADGTIYIGGYQNLYAVNPDGSEKWKCLIYNLGGRSSPAVGKDGTIYVAGFNSNQLHAVKPDGILKWNSPALGGLTTASPTIGTDGTIYIGSGQNHGNFSAIDPVNGNFKWTYDTPNIFYSSAVIGPNNTIYVCAGSDLYALSLDGSFLWSYPSGNTSWASPAIGSDGTIYFCNYDGKLFAIQSSSRWTYRDNENLMSGYADSPWPRYGQNNFNLHRALPRPPSKSLPITQILKILNENQED
jgi:outer membrane protein assembly factor BamB